MMRFCTSLSANTSGNPYLDSDGHINVEKIETLQKRVKEAEAEFPTTKPNGKPLKPPRPLQIFMRQRKAKIAKVNASLEKKRDLKYLTQRAIKVGSVRRLTDKNQLRNMVLLTVYDADALPNSPKLAKSIKLAASAITKHQKSADKTKTGVKKVKEKVRDEANKIFAVSLKAIKKILVAGGVKDKDMTMSSGMGGQTLLINLGGDNVVSIGKSDPTKFKAAKKAAEAAE